MLAQLYQLKGDVGGLPCLTGGLLGFCVFWIIHSQKYLLKYEELVLSKVFLLEICEQTML